MQLPTRQGHLVETNLICGDDMGRPGFPVRGIRQTGYDARFGDNVIGYNTIADVGWVEVGIRLDGTPSVAVSVVVGNLVAIGSSQAPRCSGAPIDEDDNTMWNSGSAIAGTGCTTEPNGLDQAPTFAGPSPNYRLAPQPHNGTRETGRAARMSTVSPAPAHVPSAPPNRRRQTIAGSAGR